MKIEHISNALIQIEHNGKKLVCDPWMTPGAWDGSWFHYPELRKRPRDLCPVDYIYISHMHPDHFDPIALREIHERSPEAHVIICASWARRMEPKLTEIGFSKIVKLQPGEQFIDEAAGLRIEMMGSFVDYIPIDSSIYIEWDGFRLLNLNENSPQTDEAIKLLESRFVGIDVAFVPYSSAGPYPQCFEMTANVVADARETLIRRRLDTFVKAVRAMGPRVAVPVAGTYCLGGKHAELSYKRAVPPRSRVRALAPNLPEQTRLCLLQEDTFLLLGKDGAVDVTGAEAEGEDAIGSYACTHYRDEPYRYDAPNWRIPPSDRIDLTPLIWAARSNMWNHQIHGDKRMLEPFTLYVDIGQPWNYWIPMQEKVVGLATDEHRDKFVAPYLRARLPYNYLVMLLTGHSHWNIADVGSHIRYKREPDEHRPWVDYALNYFHV